MLSRAELKAGQLGKLDVAQKIAEVHQELEPASRVSQTRVEKPETLGRADLERIVARQVDRYIVLGFYAEVYPGIPEEEAKTKYRADFTLPEDAAQPAEYASRFDVVLAVEPRISLTRKHELAARIKELDLDSVARRWSTSKVKEWINTGNIRDLTDHPTDVPYLIFTHDGQKYRPYSVEKALTLFEADEVGSPQLEVTDFFLQKPSLFVKRGIDAAGSRSEHDVVPCLTAFFDGPKVSADWLDYPGQLWGALSRGKEIIRLGA